MTTNNKKLINYNLASNLLFITFIAFFTFSCVSGMERRVNLDEVMGRSREIPVDYEEGDFLPLWSDSNTRFLLYTADDVDKSEEFINADELQNSTRFSVERKNVFIMHGWKGSWKSAINGVLKNALLKNAKNINVFVVDWSNRAQQLYVLARYSVSDVGKDVAKFINSMMDCFNLQPKDFTLIGHSLGAHVAGIAGQNIVQKISLIIGLDPASPLFSLNEPDTYLELSDAKFVQIIHTNAGKLGIETAIGHADYYPNGGKSQPGCGLDLTGSCSHARSYEYFAESLETSGFTARLCPNYYSFNSDNCIEGKDSHMGGLNIDFNAYGDYYLNTTSIPPFSYS